MFTTFSTALSALNANTVAVSAVGNDLANLNTTGYKNTEVAFQDLMYESLGGKNGDQLGLGTGQVQTIRQFTQGGLQTGAGSLDAALQGQGFFVVNNTAGTPMYTRDGTFTKDANGYLVDANGNRVQGWMAANGVVNANGAIGDIQIPTGTIGNPSATQNVAMTMNLNSSAAVGSADGTFSQPITVYDSLGSSHTLTATFTKTANNAWDYSVTIPGSDTTAGKAGTPTQVAKGSLTFDPNTGLMATPAASSGSVGLAITGLADGAADLGINWNLYGPSGSPLVSQVDQPSAVSGTTSDGGAAAQLTDVTMGDGGDLNAHLSNGKTVVIGQIAVANVQNPDSMLGIGNNDYQVGSTTSPVIVGTAATGGRAQVVGGALEQSTVDIGQEFTSLLSLQQAYGANSRVITTENQILQSTLALVQP